MRWTLVAVYKVRSGLTRRHPGWGPTSLLPSEVPHPPESGRPRNGGGGRYEVGNEYKGYIWVDGACRWRKSKPGEEAKFVLMFL